MPGPFQSSYGSFSVGRKTASPGTPFAVLIPPFSNQGNTGLGTGRPGQGIPHITSLLIDAGTTAHTLTILRPMNFTTFSAVANASQAVVSLTADPGVYSTSFKYGMPNGATAPRTADDPIASGDYCVYQAADGTYILDTAAGSYSAGTVTMTTNVPTGGVLAGGLFWYLGQAGDIDPNTGLAQLQFDTIAAASGISRGSYTDANGLWCGLHEGDPLVIYNPNATAADVFQLACGYYSKH